MPRPASPGLVDPSLSVDRNLRAIATDALEALKYSLMAVAAGDSPAVRGDMEQLLSGFLESRSSPIRTRFAERAEAELEASPQLRAANFGRYGQLSRADYRRAGWDGLTSRAGKLRLDAVQLKNTILTHPLNGLVSSQPQTDPDLAAGLTFKKLRLYIRQVECKEETSGIFEGDDQTNMGGNFTDPFGNTVIVNQFEVSNDFDKFEVVDFGFSKVFANWNIVTDPNQWPCVYSAVIALAEKDDGGFYKFLQGLWDKVSAFVLAAIGGATGAAVGAAAGSTFPGLGTAVGAAVGFVVGGLIAWIIALFKNEDDILGAKVVTMTLAASTKSYYDWAQLTSPNGWPFELNFKDDGHYKIRGAFKVSAL